MERKTFPVYNLQNFKIGKELGRGAFGITYLVTDDRGTKYVLKKISKKDSDLASVQNEIKILQHLEGICHNNLLCYKGDGGENPENFNVVVEYLGGYMPVDEWIKKTPREERLPILRTVMTNILMGLEDMHNAGVAHRDLKPANLMLNPHTGQVKFIDFGLACFGTSGAGNTGGDECATAGLAGTPAYLPPEYAWETEPTVDLNFDSYKLGDIWATGLTIFEIIVGSKYFDRIWDYMSKNPNMEWARLIPQWFRNEYPDIATGLEKMLRPDYHFRRSPKIRFA